ncbi:MAG: DMT family transporter [Ignavibacteria bacterium]|nr:DMT family transporter [Ignavibacteria bacterium]
MIGESAALLTALLWSATSLLFSEAANRIGSLQLNINRLIFATLLLASTILLFNIDYHLSKDQFYFLGLSGIIGLVIGDSFLFKSYLYIGPRIAMLLMALSPGMASLLSYFFLGEVISPLGIAGMFITILGIALVVLEKKDGVVSKYKITPYGLFLGIMGALGQAAGLILAKMAFNLGEINGFVATFIRIFSSVIIFFPIVLIFRKYKNPIQLYKNDLKSLGFTFAGSVVGPFLGITFSLIAVSHTKVGIASTLMSTMPIIMLPMMHYIYHEKISMRGYLGAITAVAGIAILFLR